MRKAREEVEKSDDTFDWEEWFKKTIAINDVMIVKNGRYSGEVGQVLKRTKKYRFKVQLISSNHEVIYPKDKNLEKTDDV